MKPGIKILYLILDGFPTFRPDVASLWGKYLPKKQVFCEVSTTQTKETSSTEWHSGSTYLYEPHQNKVIEQFGSFWHDCKVLWHVRKTQYDAIQVRDKTFICLPAMLFARALGIPFFYWMSFPMTDSLVRLSSRIDWKRQLLRWIFLTVRGRIGGFLLYRFILPTAHHIFVQSDRMLEDLVAKGIKREKMTAVPMCIDPDRFKSPLPFIPSAHKVVGYLGECSRVRRVDFLMEAVAIAKLQIPDIELLIVGDAYEPADKAFLAETIARLNLEDNVVITGWLPSDEALKAFARVEVALAIMAPDPLLDSTTPTKLVEYLAMGRPVIANNHPDQSFVINQSQAGLCVDFDKDQYASAIVSLLSDANNQKNMIDRGRDWVMKNRSYDILANILAKKYENLFNDSKLNEHN